MTSRAPVFWAEEVTAPRVQSSNHAAVVSQIAPFAPEVLEGLLDEQDYSYIELKQGQRVYGLACAYVAMHSEVRSLRYSPEAQSAEVHIAAAGDLAESPMGPTSLGLGFFPFKWQNQEFFALHQTLGHPVGAGANVDVYTNLVLFAPVTVKNILGRFCRQIVADSEQSESGFVNVFEWHVTAQHWQAKVVAPARPLRSVVLPAEVKSRLLGDVEEFLCQETRVWYREHGIQHKRGYLFYGPPGTGKTSMIQALAGHFEHNLCRVHLTHPQLTDESLRAAVSLAPRRSMLVFEDVDAIFGKDREKLLIDSALTFSGLLNALDGVGTADGHIFVLTTNHRGRLNSALIRNGRADLHIEFPLALDEQIAGMFARFYPFASQESTERFVSRLRQTLGSRVVSPAFLQHFFITHRRSSHIEAIESVEAIVEELDSREDEKRLTEAERSVTHGSSELAPRSKL